jgi:hypothetical protein
MGKTGEAMIITMKYFPVDQPRKQETTRMKGGINENSHAKLVPNHFVIEAYGSLRNAGCII